MSFAGKLGIGSGVYKAESAENEKHMYEFAVAPAITNLRRRGAEITEVEPESLGAELELAPGDRITRVNGRPVRDYLDFAFQTAGETELVVEVRKSVEDGNCRLKGRR